MATARTSRAAQPAEPEETTEETTVPSGADSSTDSSAATANGDFFDDAGPVFDGEQPIDQDRASFTLRPGDEQLLDLTWDPKVVRSILEATGSTLHMAAGKGETDWVFIKRELDVIAPPLARMLSRYPATAVAAGAGDELAVILGLSGYTIRSLKERKAALEKLGPAPEDAHVVEGTGVFIQTEPIPEGPL
jgi:hypothetical protein